MNSSLKYCVIAFGVVASPASAVTIHSAVPGMLGQVQTPDLFDPASKLGDITPNDSLGPFDDSLQSIFDKLCEGSGLNLIVACGGFGGPDNKNGLPPAAPEGPLMF